MNKPKIERSPRLVYKGGYKYQLQQPYWIQTSLRPETYVSNGWVSLDTDGKMFFMPGYAWDGVTGGPDTPEGMAGSLVHDGGYQLMRAGLLPQSAKATLDLLMQTTMFADGMYSPWVKLFYWAVSKFGRRYTTKPTKTITLPTP